MSARMSLSTMSLGRFMREMFGDAPEPWLTNTGRTSTATIPPQKEGTVSNTNGSQPLVRPPTATEATGAPVQVARTPLDLPEGAAYVDALREAEPVRDAEIESRRAGR